MREANEVKIQTNPVNLKSPLPLKVQQQGSMMMTKRGNDNTIAIMLNACDVFALESIMSLMVPPAPPLLYGVQMLVV